MTWDNTIPLATESLKLGDDRIRETKEDFQNAIDDEKIFPGPNPLTAPVCYDKILSGTAAARPAASASNTGRFYHNTDDNVLQMDNGGSWITITSPKDLFPSGSVIAFYQASAPTGWSQLTDSSYLDRTLRVVSGSGAATGGSVGISSPPTHTHDGVTGATAVDHTHTVTYSTFNGPASISTDVVTFSIGTSSSTSHTHTINSATGFTPAYIDMILAARI